jgi:hypothetical protein
VGRLASWIDGSFDDSPSDVMDKLRERAVGISLANLPLFGFVVVTLATFYGSALEASVIPTFVLLELAVFGVGAALSFRGSGEVIRRIFRISKGRWSAITRVVRRAGGRLLPDLGGYEAPITQFLAMLILILTNFFAVGRVINSTGGVLGSPYIGFPVTMLILGGLMAERAVSRFGILLFGVLYFIGLSHAHALWAGDGDVLRRVSSDLSWLFVTVTAVNLAVSFVLIPGPETNGSANGGAPASDRGSP